MASTEWVRLFPDKHAPPKPHVVRELHHEARLVPISISSYYNLYSFTSRPITSNSTMKNLNVWCKIRTDFKTNIIGQCHEADNKRYFALTENFQLLESLADGINFELVHHDFKLGDIGLAESKITRDDVILIEFVVEIGSILVILKNGHFVTIAVSSYSQTSGSKYKHPKDISSAQLSPDQDLIVLADTEANLCILTTIEFDHVCVSNALSQNESLHKPVGVGWGSKETQFFGLDGRPAKEKEDKIDVTLTDEELSRIGEIEQSNHFNYIRCRRQKSTIVNWRGDGQLLASLTSIPQTGKHYLKVWNRKLELQYMSEQLVMMEGGLLSWIPNGQYVCCAQQRDHYVNEVAMFEKNGMVHQRLRLPKLLKNSYICDLSWSVDSKILCIVCAKFNISKDGIQKSYLLLLYTMQNFHYYLKYTSKLEEADNFIIRWDPIKTNRLYVSSTNGQCYEYDCIFTVNNSTDNSTVVVVDSQKLMITPFRLCNIPPPMSAIQLELESLVNKVVVDPITADLLILTADDKVIIVTKSNDERMRAEYNFETSSYSALLSTCVDNISIKNFKNQLNQIHCFNLERGHQFQNLIIISRRSFVAIKQTTNTTEIHLLEPYHQIHGQKGIPRDTIIKTIKQQVIAITSDTKSRNTITLFLDDYSCMELDLITGDYRKKFAISTNNESLNLIEISKLRTNMSSEKSIVTLSEDLTLRLDELVLVSKCCTSFRVTENFLVYTTTENNLHFIPTFKLPSDTESDVESWSQPIEMGGTLVTVSELDSKVILQMPRGNLEILHPRILVLQSVADLLDGHKFINAMKEAKRHRLDMNFLVDYGIRKNSEHFFRDTLNKLVLNVVDNEPGLLNILLNELNNEDSLSTRYKSTVKFLPIMSCLLEPIIDQKVNRICSAIDKRLLDKQSTLLCILKQEPRNMERALLEVFNPADEEVENAALKFILYFVDIEHLLIEALATYNTDLALMVARVSTKDPKEYLALLDEFNAIKDPFLRRYKIDLHVKNYEKAFTHLLSHYRCEITDNEVTKQELVDFVVAKRLYKYAIRNIPAESNNIERLTEFKHLIWVKYGDYLYEKRYHLEAGISYSKAIMNIVFNRHIFNKAMSCFLLIGDWERCLMLATRYYVDESTRGLFSDKIIKILLDRGLFAEVTLAKQKLSSPDIGRQDDKLADHLLEKGSWYLALIVVGEPSVIQVDKIIKCLLQAAHDQYAVFKTELDTARVHYDRLKKLIEDHQVNSSLRKQDADNCYTSDNLSTVDGSEISSIVAGSINRGVRSGAPSIKTKITTKSSKNAQTSRAKRINLKAGSRHEDIALSLELRKFIKKQVSNQKRANSLLAAHGDFASLNVLDHARELFQGILAETLEFAQEVQINLWPKNDQTDQLYSLYRRFGDMLSSSWETLEPVELKILQRPELSKSLTVFEL